MTIRVLSAVMEALKEEEGAQAWIREVNAMPASEQHARWRHLITRVEVGRRQLRITVDPNGMMNTELVKPEDGAGREKLRQGQGRVLEVPWAITRRGGHTELRLKGAPGGNLCPTPRRICDRGGSGLSMER